MLVTGRYQLVEVVVEDTLVVVGGLSSPLYFQTCAFPRLWRHFRTTSEKTYNHPSEALKPGPLFFWGKKFEKKFTKN